MDDVNPLALLGLGGWLLWLVWIVAYSVVLIRADPEPSPRAAGRIGTTGRTSTGE